MTRCALAVLVLALATLPKSSPAQNDHFADAIDLSNRQLDYEFFQTGATAEPGEPDHAGSPAVGSIWFQFLTPENQTYRVQEIFGGRIAVYTGASLDQLSTVAEASGKLLFQTAGGIRYWVAVDSESYKVIEFYRYPRGGADEATEATLLPAALPQRIRGHNFFATASPTDEEISPRFPPRSTVWWEWTPQVTGKIRLDLRFSGASVTYIVYEKAADGSLILAPALDHVFTAGTDYLFRFDEALNGQGEIDVWFEQAPTASPPNDEIANAIVLEGGPIICVDAWTLGATGNPSLPGENFWEPTIWWRWTCPTSGSYVATSLGTGYETGVQLSVFTGSPSALTLVGNGDLNVVFTATSGTQYWIRAFSYFSHIELSLYPGSSPAPYFKAMHNMSLRPPARPLPRGAQRHPKADPDGDTIPNDLELALGTYPDMDPPSDALRHPNLSFNPTNLTFYATTTQDYLNSITFLPQSAESPDGPWQSGPPPQNSGFQFWPVPDGHRFVRLLLQDPALDSD